MAELGQSPCQPRTKVLNSLRLARTPGHVSAREREPGIRTVRGHAGERAPKVGGNQGQPACRLPPRAMAVVEAPP
eukprot:4795985-Prymnesium_polylepis.1